MSGETCVVCGLRIDGVFVGMGDGTGQEFGHEVCYLRAENARLAAERDEYDRAHNEAMLLHAAEKARADRLAAALEQTQVVLQGLHAGLSAAVYSAHSVMCGTANDRPCAVVDQMADNRAALAAEPQEVGDAD